MTGYLVCQLLVREMGYRACQLSVQGMSDLSVGCCPKNRCLFCQLPVNGMNILSASLWLVFQLPFLGMGVLSARRLSWGLYLLIHETGNDWFSGRCLFKEWTFYLHFYVKGVIFSLQKTSLCMCPAVSLSALKWNVIVVIIVFPVLSWEVFLERFKNILIK